jgi:hypothetical protein
VRLGCGRDAAGEEQFCKDQGKTGGFGERIGLFNVRLGDEPTLKRALAWG